MHSDNRALGSFAKAKVIKLKLLRLKLKDLDEMYFKI